MHHWIGGIIKPAEKEELLYWFTEGFTDYFAHYNLYSGRFTSAATYKQTIDSIFAVHYSNPVNLSPNSIIADKFWSDPIIQKLPYNRGFIYALYLDALIRKDSRGTKNLRGVMQKILATAKSGERVGTNYFIDLMKSFISEDIRYRHEEYIVNGNYIPIGELNRVTENDFLLKEKSVFDLGFTTRDGSLNKGSIIQAITQRSNAAIAGLLKGNIITGYSYYNDFQGVNVVCNPKWREEGVSILPCHPDKRSPNNEWLASGRLMLVLAESLHLIFPRVL